MSRSGSERASPQATEPKATDEGRRSPLLPSGFREQTNDPRGLFADRPGVRDVCCAETISGDRFGPVTIRCEPDAIDELLDGEEVMRLAWFTPLPPVRSGVATYSAELLPLLAARHEIDVYVDSSAARLSARVTRHPADDPSSVRSTRGHAQRTCNPLPAHNFIWRHQRAPYDLIVYQLGNASCHDYIWPYLARYPGLVVLHDAQLHHARARALLARGMRQAYRDEFRFSHPGAPREIEELFIAGLGGSLTYFWPMLRVACSAARAVVVHNERLAADLREQFPDAAIEAIRMGVADPAVPGFRGSGPPGPPDSEPRIAGTSGPCVFVAFGRVTPEKRISVILRALAWARQYADVQLLLVGEPVEYYDAVAEARELGVAERVQQTGFVPDAELPAYLATADVCLCLRWPTGRETSASWLRCLAAGKPTVVTDLVHTSEVPALDPRTWTPTIRCHAAATNLQPVCVSVDILDEEHSLKLAMRRLARDAALRLELGRAARAFWEHSHTLEQMAEDYERILAGLVRAPERPTVLPPHLRQDGAEHLRALLSEMAVRDLEW